MKPLSCGLGCCKAGEICCHPDNPDCGNCTEACCNSDDPCCNVNCDDEDACTTDSCDPDTGACLFDPVVCDQGQICCNGSCVSGASGAAAASGDPLTCCNGEEVCPASHCCPINGCCPDTCEGCIDNGTLTEDVPGDSITVSPQVACLGDTITFTLSGVTDSGGVKRVECTAKEEIPPGEADYEWTLTLPPDYPEPLPPLSGSGSTVSVTAEVAGTYSVTFTASAQRECPPPPITVGCGVGGGSANLVIDANNGDPGGEGPTRTWTLQQAVVASDGGDITMWGDITIVDTTSGTTTLAGGWTWSQASGPQLDPASDAGFQEAVAELFNVALGTGGEVAGLPPALGSLLQWIANVLGLPINYILDFFIPYTPPAPGSCSGPSVDGTCSPDDVVCQDSLAEMCESVADIPGVSTAFKQCMKGRCGCGGSSFPPARITCDDADSCGPCGYFGDVGGCSSFGARLWYCQTSPSTVECWCANVVFHEMAHACGALDDPTCETKNGCPPPASERFSGSCAVGTWFHEECCAAR